MSNAEGYETISINKSAEVSELLESRGIFDDELKMVIYDSETTNEKLCDTDNNEFLGKKTIGNALYFVRYSKDADIYKIHTAYCIKSAFDEES